MFNMAAGSTNAWPDVLAPLPTQFIHGATNRHPTDVDQLKTTLLQNANFVRRFKPLEDHRYLPAAHSSIDAWCGQAQPWQRQLMRRPPEERDTTRRPTALTISPGLEIEVRSR